MEAGAGRWSGRDSDVASARLSARLSLLRDSLGGDPAHRLAGCRARADSESSDHRRRDSITCSHCDGARPHRGTVTARRYNLKPAAAGLGPGGPPGRSGSGRHRRKRNVGAKRRVEPPHGSWRRRAEALGGENLNGCWNGPPECGLRASSHHGIGNTCSPCVGRLPGQGRLGVVGPPPRRDSITCSHCDGAQPHRGTVTARQYNLKPCAPGTGGNETPCVERSRTLVTLLPVCSPCVERS